jgi:hypothetical protein
MPPILGGASVVGKYGIRRAITVALQFFRYFRNTLVPVLLAALLAGYLRMVQAGKQWFYRTSLRDLTSCGPAVQKFTVTTMLSA